MASRTSFRGGSYYPTGRYPFAMDLTPHIRAITQQQIQNRREEIKQNKLQISESEEAILNALDFKTLEDAGDKFAQEHAKRLGLLTDKWSKKFRERGGILSTADKLELQKDKREIEQKLAVGAAEIKQYEALTKELHNAKSPLSLPENYQWMNEYVGKGLLGTGGLLTGIKVKEQPFGEEFLKKIETIAPKEFLNTAHWSDVPTGTDKYGNTIHELSNKQIVDNFVDNVVVKSPEYIDLYNQDPEQAENLKESIRQRYTRTKPDFYKPAAKPSSRIVYTDEEFPELKNKAQVAAAKNWNDFAERLYQGDEDAINQLKGDKYSSIVVEPDKFILIDNKGEEQTIDRNVGKLQFKQILWDYVPDNIKQGLSGYNASVFTNENYEVSKPIQKAELSSIRSFKSQIDESNEPETIISSIKELIPDANITYKKPKKVFGQTIIYGEFKFNDKSYDLNNPKDKESLKEDVISAYEGGGKKVELIAPNREFTLKDGSVVTAKELVDKLIENGMSEQEAIEKVNSK